MATHSPGGRWFCTTCQRFTELNLDREFNCCARCSWPIWSGTEWAPAKNTEKDRLGRLVSAYQTAEAERVAREERERQAEFQRLEQERLEMERKAAQEAPGSAKAIRFEQKAADAMDAASTVLTMPPAEVSKAKGAATRMILRWEITDEAALYAAAPHLFYPPEPKDSAIRSTCHKDTKLPGIRFYEEPQTVFRS